MKMQRYFPINPVRNGVFLILPVLLIVSTCFSDCKSYKARRSRAFSHIEQLKDRVLLVRLNTAEHSIDALRQANKIKEADYVETRAKNTNEKIVDAFKQYYTFSKVYFFYSGESTKLKAGQYQQVRLFDGDKHPVADPAFLQDGYLVAAIGNVYQDIYLAEDSTARYFLAGTGGGGLPALVLMDKDYIPLGKPFPRYVGIDPNKGFVPATARSLNAQLTRYYNRSMRRKYRY